LQHFLLNILHHGFHLKDSFSFFAIVARQEANSVNEPENNDEQEHIRIARAFLNYRLKEKMAMANYPHASPFHKKFPMQQERKPCFGQSSHSSHSKILPLFRPRSKSRSRPESPASTDGGSQSTAQTIESLNPRSRFPAAEAPPYVPVGHYRMPCHSMAPSVTIRTAVPVFSAPPLPPPAAHTQQLPPLMGHPPPIRMASPVRIRPATSLFGPNPVHGPKPGISVQIKDAPHQSIKESASPVIPVLVKDVQSQPIKEAMPVQVKEVERQSLMGSLSPVIPIQMKDAQPQQLKDSLCLGKSAPLAAPSPAIRPLIKIEAPAETKGASKVVTSEVLCSNGSNAAVVECTKDSDVLPTQQLKAADVGDKKAEAEAQAVAEAAIKLLEIN
jgi:hypothetical protein